MNLFVTEIGSALMVSAVFLAIFGIAEILRGFNACSMEMSRKFVHLAAGLVAVSFAYVFSSHWTLLLMCSGFVILMKGGKALNLLTAIHGVDRKSSGDILHPISLYLTFLITAEIKRPEYYVISTLVLSISDTLAALIGQSYGVKIYKVEEEKKSIEGSLIFLLSTFIIVHLGLLLLSDVGRPESVLTALVIAILVTIFEAISLGGADNFFIPFGTLFILTKLAGKPAPELAFRVGLIIFMLISTWAISIPKGKFGTSGIIAIGLTGYGSWVLVDWTWYIPILTTSILLAFSDAFIEIRENDREQVRVRPVFYMFVVSLAWILAGSYFPYLRRTLIVPFIVTMTANLSVRWGWQIRSTQPKQNALLPLFMRRPGFAGRAIILTGVFLPFFLIVRDFGLPTTFSIVSCFVGTALGDRLYWLFGSRHIGVCTRIDYLRMGMLVMLVSSAVVFAANLLYFQVSLFPG